MNQIRIAVAAHCLTSQKSGIGRYVAELLRYLPEVLPSAEIILFSNRKIDLESAAERIVKCEYLDPVSRRMPAYLWLKFVLPWLLRKCRPDVLWCPTTLVPYGCHDYTVTTVHDLNHVLVKDTMPFFNALLFSIWFNSDVRKSCRIVANSQGTAGRLEELLGVRADEIVRPAISSNFRDVIADRETQEFVASRRPFVLAVSTIEPRKNILSLIKAFSQLKASGKLPAHKLILVGKRGWKNSELEAYLAHEDHGSILFTGHVTDEELAEYYRNADLFVMPSIYEGFGMPAAEAMSVGVPVLTSDVPELREATQGLANYAEADVNSLKEGLLTCMENRTPASDCVTFQPLSWQREAGKLSSLFLEVRNSRA